MTLSCPHCPRQLTLTQLKRLPPGKGRRFCVEYSCEGDATPHELFTLRVYKDMLSERETRFAEWLERPANQDTDPAPD